MASSASPNKVRKRIFFVITNVISVICLVWTLHGANLGELRKEIPHLDWRWAAAGLVLSALVFLIPAWRWTLVLKPVKPVPMWDAVRATYVGQFFNIVFPLRAGEIIRCYLLGRLTGIPVSVTLASALIERIFDGIWLVVCLFLTARYVRLPPEFVAGGYVLVGLLLVCALLVGLGMYWKQRTLDLILGAKWLSWVHVLIDDLHQIGHSRYLYFAFMASLPCILIQVLPIYAVVHSYAKLPRPTFLMAFALMVIQHLGTVVPQAPGNVGVYNGITVLGLRLFGVPLSIAKRFSFLLWAAITLPLLIAGFLAVAVTGVKMGELHRKAREHMRSQEPQPQDSPVG